jgi:hypothetical protein
MSEALGKYRRLMVELYETGWAYDDCPEMTPRQESIIDETDDLWYYKMTPEDIAEIEDDAKVRYSEHRLLSSMGPPTIDGKWNVEVEGEFVLDIVQTVRG